MGLSSQTFLTMKKKCLTLQLQLNMNIIHISYTFWKKKEINVSIYLNCISVVTTYKYTIGSQYST